MKKVILPLVLFFSLIFASNSFAQDYKSAIGARLGYPLSISYKTFLTESNAIEVYAGTRGFGGAFGLGYRWYSVSGAYQIHKPLNIDGVEGLKYYFGAGPSVYFWSFGDGFSGNNSSTTFGIQGYLGLDYTFADSPIDITVDWIPTYFFGDFGGGFGGGYGSLGIRYIFSR